MSYPIYEAKTVDKAIAIAAADLKIDADALEYDVISHGSSGIFGLVGAKKAKIRVLVSSGGEVQDAPSAQEVKSLVDEAFNTGRNASSKPRKQKPAATSKPAPKPKQKPAPRPEPKPVEKPVEAKSEERPKPAPQAPPAVREEKKAPQVPDAMAQSVNAQDIREEELVEVPDAAVEKGLGVLNELVRMISEGGNIKVEKQPGRVLFSVEGGDSGMLIGKRGQTLEAIQYLVDKVINKNTEQRVRVQIDVEGYLETRRESLETLAAKLAERTRRTGKPSTIGQMTAHDRRIVHLALKDDKTVRTQSMGDGYYRKLVIFPKKAAGQKRRRGPGGKKSS